VCNTSFPQRFGKIQCVHTLDFKSHEIQIEISSKTLYTDSLNGHELAKPRVIFMCTDRDCFKKSNLKIVTKEINYCQRLLGNFRSTVHSEVQQHWGPSEPACRNRIEDAEEQDEVGEEEQDASVLEELENPEEVIWLTNQFVVPALSPKYSPSSPTPPPPPSQLPPIHPTPIPPPPPIPPTPMPPPPPFPPTPITPPPPPPPTQHSDSGDSDDDVIFLHQEANGPWEKDHYPSSDIDEDVQSPEEKKCRQPLSLLHTPPAAPPSPVILLKSSITPSIPPKPIPPPPPPLPPPTPPTLPTQRSESADSNDDVMLLHQEANGPRKKDIHISSDTDEEVQPQRKRKCRAFRADELDDDEDNQPFPAEEIQYNNSFDVKGQPTLFPEE
jgi:hypothetical protein